ncbi:MAG TPA: hypothetical protein VGI99_00260 [Gemmataceae bacterium]|jgi:hypothetical protein
MLPAPIVLNLLAANRVALDRSSGTCDLRGVFHALSLPLPANLSFAVYYVLTAVHEPLDLGLYIDGPNDERLGGGTVRIGIRNPLSVIEGTATFDVELVRPGTHRLKLEYRGEVLAERPLLVTEA